MPSWTLVWSGQAMSNETVMSWEMDTMRFGSERSPLTVRDGSSAMAARCGSSVSAPGTSLPHAAPGWCAGRGGCALGEERRSRPEHYDFDLFQMSEEGALWTTGFCPS
ncbi:MAG: hypothetical protein R3E55_04015 [Burkholderiaceae bacterium]